MKSEANVERESGEWEFTCDDLGHEKSENVSGGETQTKRVKIMWRENIADCCVGYRLA